MKAASMQEIRKNKKEAAKVNKKNSFIVTLVTFLSYYSTVCFHSINSMLASMADLRRPNISTTA
jgi:hypothetical protein